MIATEKRSEAVRLIKMIVGKNDYNQARPCYIWGNPEGKFPGRGDCSGTVRDVILRVAGVDIGSNTSAQVSNALKGKGIIIERPSGNYFDESKLKPGDCLYFKGNSAHTENVGHVEMYTGKNECCGHGSGKGPTKKNLKSYCAGRTGTRKALMAVRWIKDGEEDKPLKLGDRALTKGCKDLTANGDVTALQTLLLTLGYSLPKYGADGDYGSETAAAVKAHQVAYGLAQTGNADKTTIESIQATMAGKTIAAKQYVKISGGKCYVRTGPGTEYPDIGDAKDGEKFEFSGQIINGWPGIKYKGTNAFVSGKYGEVV